MAELVLILHLLVVLFFVAGFPVGLAINHAGFRYCHCAALIGITLLMVLGIPCPLTVLEENLAGESYGGSFLAVWLNRIIYMQWFDPGNVLIADVIFVLLVISSFYWRPVPRNKAPRRGNRSVS